MENKSAKPAPRQTPANVLDATSQNPRFGTSRGHSTGFGSMAGPFSGGSAGPFSGGSTGPFFGGSAGALSTGNNRYDQVQPRPVNPFNFGASSQAPHAARVHQSKNKRPVPSQTQGGGNGRWHGNTQHVPHPGGNVNTGHWFSESRTVPWDAHPGKGLKRPECSQDMPQQYVEKDEGKNSKQKFCFRCFTKGHVTGECQASVYCEVCESTEHVRQKCPVMKAPKMVAQLVGYAADGEGFYHIPHAPIKSTSDQKTARITVEGGQLTVEQLTLELQSRIPSPNNWLWDVREDGQDSFIVNMPTKDELQRAISFGGMTLKERGVHLNFMEWSEEEEGLLIPKAWINIFRIPKKLRELPVLWALGSMVGAPQLVDMVTTKNNAYGRVLISVINSKAFPQKLCVVIGDRWFEFPVKVESILPGVESYVEDIRNDNDPEGDDDDLLGDEDKRESNNDTRKKQKNGQQKGQSSSSTKQMDVDTDKATDDDCNQQQPSDEHLRKLANNILDVVVNNLLGEAADKVLFEDNDGEKQNDDSMLEDGTGTRLVDVQGSDPVLEPFSQELNGSLHLSQTDGTEADGLQQGDQHQDQGGGSVNGPAKEVSAASFVGEEVRPEHDGGGVDGPEQQESVVLVGDVPGATPPNRTSKRRANSMDEHSLQRAQRMAAKRNLDTPKGHFQGDILDKTLGFASEGGGQRHYIIRLSSFGDLGYGDLRKEWVAVQ